MRKEKFVRMTKLTLALAVCVFALAQQTSKAISDTATYNLSVGNSAISGYAAPYGSVTVSWSSADANQATITFTANNTGTFQYLFGDGGSVAVNVNAAS